MYSVVLCVTHRTFNSVAVKRKQVHYGVGCSVHVRGDVITVRVKQRYAGYLPLWF
jgi:hypothetical protein